MESAKGFFLLSFSKLSFYFAIDQCNQYELSFYPIISCFRKKTKESHNPCGVHSWIFDITWYLKKQMNLNNNKLQHLRDKYLCVRVLLRGDSAWNLSGSISQLDHNTFMQECSSGKHPSMRKNKVYPEGKWEYTVALWWESPGVILHEGWQTGRSS